MIIDNYVSPLFLKEQSFDYVVSTNVTMADAYLDHFIEQIVALGTHIDNQKLTPIRSFSIAQESKDLFYKLCEYNLDRVVNNIHKIYVKSVLLEDENYKLVNIAFIIHMIALLTSAIDKNGLPNAVYRSKGYELVQMFKNTVHMFMWIKKHFELSDKSKSGTGSGFRKAVERWYLNGCTSIYPTDLNNPNSWLQKLQAENLASEIVNNGGCCGMTHDKLLSLIHIKTTTKKKCKNCSQKCNCSKSDEVTNIIPVSFQVSIAYAMGGLAEARLVLLNNLNDEPTDDIVTALEIFAYLCAYMQHIFDEAFNEPSDESINLDEFKLDAVNDAFNHALSSVKKEKRREILLQNLPNHSLINKIFSQDQN